MKHLATTLLLLFIAFGAQPALAAQPWQAQNLRPVAQKSGGMTLDQAVNRVRKNTKGRILSAKTVREEGRKVHRIKVLTPKNKVRIFTFPAE